MVTKDSAWRLVLLIPGSPVGQPRARHGRDRKGTMRHWVDESHPVAGFRGAVALAAREKWRTAPWDGPVAVRALYAFPARAKGVVAGQSEWYAQKPDCDNINKAVYDALNRLVWKDDSQVVSEYVQKIRLPYGQKPYVIIEITPAVFNPEEILKFSENPSEV